MRQKSLLGRGGNILLSETQNDKHNNFRGLTTSVSKNDNANLVPPSPVMDTDSNDSMPKSGGLEPSPVLPLDPHQPSPLGGSYASFSPGNSAGLHLSSNNSSSSSGGIFPGTSQPVTLQMQRHLLSSTLLQTTTSDLGGGSSKLLGRTGSCSPTPALPYTPTPSPSPFNPLSHCVTSSLPELHLSLSSDSKSINFLPDLKPPTSSFTPPGGRNSGFFDLEVCERPSGSRPNSGKFPFLGSPPLTPSNQTEVMVSLPNYTSQLELPSVLNFTDTGHHQNLSSLPPVVSSHQDKIKSYIVMDGSGPIASNTISVLQSSQGNIVGMGDAATITVNRQQQQQQQQQQQHVSAASLQILPKPEPRLRIVSDLQPCLTTLNPVSSHQQITCITDIPNLSPTVTTQMTCLSAVSTLSTAESSVSTNQNTASLISAGYDSYTTATNLVHPKKKQRLLTFLANDTNTADHQQTLIVNQNQPSTSETYILSSNVPSLVAVSSHSPALILNPSAAAVCSTIKPESTLFIGPAGNPLVPVPKNNPSSTIYLSDGSGSINAETKTEHHSGVFLNSQDSGLGKNEQQQQTLIINSDGTQATLITPVTAEQTLIATNSQDGTILAPVSGANNHHHHHHTLIQSQPQGYNPGTILTTPTLSFRPVLNPALSVESLVGAGGGGGGGGRENTVEPASTLLSVNFSVKPATETEEILPLCLTNNANNNNSNSNNASGNNSGVRTEDLPPSLENYMETVNFVKCKLCGYLATDRSGMEMHLTDDHEERLGNLQTGDEERVWLTVAQRSGVKLNCPFCANLFSSERSFQVHLTEDHASSESTALFKLSEEVAERKRKTLTIMREERQRLREERRRSRCQVYEAYLDSNGSLRIRRGDGGSPPDVNPTEDEADKDSRADGIDDDQEEDGDDTSCGGDAFDCDAADYVSMVLSGKLMKQPPQLGMAKQVKQERLGDEGSSEPRRKRVGRPKGSRSIGLTAVKKVNPGIVVSEEMMGEQCGVENCGVRLKDPENLKLHRFTHRGSEHYCPQCSESFPSWHKCALHLWRLHGRDMELFACNFCDYRSITAAVMEKHKLTHSDERPHLCPDCGRAFKARKQLKEHFKVVHKKVEGGYEAGSKAKYQFETECDVCQKRFSSSREVRYHKERVHKKLKPWLCSHCGYAAFSRTTLRLHMRSHSGAKPYECSECNYRTGDHNSLRRHAMRHSGERPYRCPHCPYAAIQSTCFRAHLRNKHPGEAAVAGRANSPRLQCSQCSFNTEDEAAFLKHTAEQHTSVRTRLADGVKTEQPDRDDSTSRQSGSID